MKNEIDKTVERIGPTKEQNEFERLMNDAVNCLAMLCPKLTTDEYDAMLSRLERIDTNGRKHLTSLATAKQGLEHYADESFWDDLHPDLGYTKGTLYNFEDEIDGEIPGHQIAQQTLAAIGKE